MLVLTRRTEQVLLIGGNIRVTILGVDGNRVKVGIEAPDDVRILREEVLERGDDRWDGNCGACEVCGFEDPEEEPTVDAPAKAAHWDALVEAVGQHYPIERTPDEETCNECLQRWPCAIGLVLSGYDATYNRLHARLVQETKS